MRARAVGLGGEALGLLVGRRRRPEVDALDVLRDVERQRAVAERRSAARGRRPGRPCGRGRGSARARGSRSRRPRRGRARPAARSPRPAPPGSPRRWVMTPVGSHAWPAVRSSSARTKPSRSPSSTRWASPTSKSRAVVLDHRVRVQDVGADLRAEVDVLRLAALARAISSRRSALLALEQLRAQHRHRGVACWPTASARSGTARRSRRAVGDAHGRVGLVDVLAAGARGAVGVDLQVVVVDLDVADVLDDRRDLDAGERRLAAVGGVERRQPHEPVDALLGAEEPVGVLARGAERRRLDAGLLPRRWPRAARPAKPRRSAQRITIRSTISAQSWASVPPAPALTVTSASPRVVAAGEQPLLLELGQALLDAAPTCSSSSRGERRVLLGQLGERLEVVDVALERRASAPGGAPCARARRSTCAAVCWSSQKPGAPIRPSSSAVRAASAEGSTPARMSSSWPRIAASRCGSGCRSVGVAIGLGPR